MLHPRVVVLRGDQVLAEHSLPPGTEIVVGRSEGCDVTVADGSVSRLHARLVADEEGVYVEDLGSANGTFVDGQRTRGRVRLADGQQVRAAQRAQSAPLVLRFEDVAPPADGMLTAVEKVMVADETADAHAGGPARTLPPPPPPTPHEPLWRAGALLPPVAATVPVAEIPSKAPTPQPTHGPMASPKALVTIVAVVALVGALAAAALGAWWFLGSRRAATTASAAPAVYEPALASPTARQPSSVSPASAAATSFPAPAEVLVVPVESDTGAATADVGAKPIVPAAARANPLSGKWTARLENVFYPEDDYVVELDLELEQRSTRVSGSGKVRIENRSMTFGVPATAASGTVQTGGPPSQMRLRLAFGRPIGELQLEGTLDGDALAGTFHSSTAKQAGAWQAVRAPG